MSRKIWTFCVFIFVVMQVNAQQPPEATQQFLPKLLPKSPRLLHWQSMVRMK